MPGGSPQETILGLFIFLVQIKLAGFERENTKLGWRITKAVNKRKEIGTNHWKYIDDLTIAKAIDLKHFLKTDHDLSKPLGYQNRTEHILKKEDSKVSTQQEELEKYDKEN